MAAKWSRVDPLFRAVFSGAINAAFRDPEWFTSRERLRMLAAYLTRVADAASAFYAYCGSGDVLDQRVLHRRRAVHDVRGHQDARAPVDQQPVDDHDDAEHVPGAIRPPRSAATHDVIRCLDRGERSGHPDLARLRIDEDRLPDLELGERAPSVRHGDLEPRGDVGQGRRPAARNDLVVDENAKGDGIQCRLLGYGILQMFSTPLWECEFALPSGSAMRPSAMIGLFQCPPPLWSVATC